MHSHHSTHDLKSDPHSDPQVKKAMEEQTPRTLCDVVCKEVLHGGGRHPERPLVSRIAFVGEIVSKDDPPRNFFEEILNNAARVVNAQDPTGGRINDSSNELVCVTGVYVEMQAHFFQLIESEPEHLIQVMRELNGALNERHSYEGVRNLHIVYYSDDTMKRAFPKWVVLEAALSATLPRDRPLEDLIVEAVQGLVNLGGQLLTQGKMQMENFLSTVRTTLPQFIPKSVLVERCMSSGLCLTLQEYVEVFGSLPDIARPSELVQPSEPPLKY